MPCVGVSLDVMGVGRVGIGGIVERNVTGSGGCGTSAGLLPDPGDKLVPSSDTDGGGQSIIVLSERDGCGGIGLTSA